MFVLASVRGWVHCSAGPRERRSLSGSTVFMSEICDKFRIPGLEASRSSRLAHPLRPFATGAGTLRNTNPTAIVYGLRIPA